ncbi:MAG: PAS domain S-box protein [Syntrophobacteraceae bacterium]
MKDEDKTRDQLIMELKKIRAEEALRQSEEKYRELVEASNSIILRMDKDGVNDITERKRSEEELQNLASIVRHSSELVNLATLDGKMIFLNDAGARVLGIDREEVEQTHISQVLPDHLQEKLRNEILPLLIMQGSWEGDLQARNLKTGKLIDVHTTAFSIKDPHTGEARFLANISRDITEYKAAELALQESRQQLSDIIDFLPDATLVVDLQGKVIAWNKAIEEMTGVQKEAILGNSKDHLAVAIYGRPRPILLDLVLQDDRRLLDLYDHVERRGNALYTEIYVQGALHRRSRYISAIASPLYDRNGSKIGAIQSIRDITERREMEKALLEREKELESKSLDLEEINTALRVLLKNREEDQREFGADVLTNLKELVFPYIGKLKESRLNDMQKTYLSILESHLLEIRAPFLRQLSIVSPSLSPVERQIAGLIKEGKQNKEISDILGVSLNTIATHRYHLRTKLGLKNKNINLVSYLQSLPTL